MNTSVAAMSSKSTDASTSNHFLELDGMRGVLATTVMLFHFGLNTLVSKFTHGIVHGEQWPLCVDFFFALSGFVLCRSFIRRPPDLSQYAIKRVFRLAPMFILTLFAALWLPGPDHWSLSTVIANVLMVQSLIFRRSINFPAWSIPFELFLPAIGLFAIGPLKRFGKTGLWGLLLALVLAQGLATYGLARGYDYQWLRAGLGLASGGVLYLVRDAGSKTGSNRARIIYLAAFAGALLIMALSGLVPLLALGFPALTAIAIWYGADSRGLFTLPPIGALGRWSYSIYLLHIPVLMATNALLGESMVEGHASVKFAMVVVVLSLAGFCYRFIEAPMIALGGAVVSAQRSR